MEKIKCETCKWWQPYGDDSFIGDCRYSLPVIGHDIPWPAVKREDWCRMWKGKTSEGLSKPGRPRAASNQKVLEAMKDFMLGEDNSRPIKIIFRFLSDVIPLSRSTTGRVIHELLENGSIKKTEAGSFYIPIYNNKPIKEQEDNTA